LKCANRMVALSGPCTDLQSVSISSIYARHAECATCIIYIWTYVAISLWPYVSDSVNMWICNVCSMCWKTQNVDIGDVDSVDDDYYDMSVVSSSSNMTDGGEVIARGVRGPCRCSVSPLYPSRRRFLSILAGRCLLCVGDAAAAAAGLLYSAAVGGYCSYVSKSHRIRWCFMILVTGICLLGEVGRPGWALSATCPQDQAYQQWLDASVFQSASCTVLFSLCHALFSHRDYYSPAVR